MIAVYVTTTFEGFHRWPDAPNPVGFLRELHRHTFHVRLEVKVNHDDRDVEFILLKREVDGWIAEKTLAETDTWSCERWARELMDRFDAIRVEVSEDGENGAIVTRD